MHSTPALQISTVTWTLALPDQTKEVPAAETVQTASLQELAQARCIQVGEHRDGSLGFFYTAPTLCIPYPVSKGRISQSVIV